MHPHFTHEQGIRLTVAALCVRSGVGTYSHIKHLRKEPDAHVLDYCRRALEPVGNLPDRRKSHGIVLNTLLVVVFVDIYHLLLIL